MSPRTHRSSALALLGVVLGGPVLAASAGCASLDPDAAPSPSRAVAPSASARPLADAGAGGARAGEPDGPEATYRAWLDALAARDAATACTIQAPELTIDLRYRAILLDRAELGDPCTGFEALLWEDPLREYEPASVEVTQETAEKATLAVRFPRRTLTVRLRVNRAAWRVVDETPRASAGAEQDDAAQDDAARAGAPTRWLDAWCSLSVGDPRADVVAAMGEPSGVYTVANGGEPQLWWALRQYDFRAYLDADGPDARVLDLVGDYDALGAAERARLPCPELR